MTPKEREEKIASYGRAYENLIDGVRQFPEEMWDFRDEHGCWSIKEHLVHITDSEVNSYIRCRRFVAEPGQPLMAYDENAWGAALGYPEQDPRQSMELFRLLRNQTHNLIETLPEEAWASVCYHPENGDMTMDDWLAVYEAHIPEHLSYMKDNYDAWLKTRQERA